MKKIILSIVLASFAVAVQAGDGACCAAKQATTETKADMKSCPMADKQANATCTKAKNTKFAKQQQLKSPKAYADARR